MADGADLSDFDPIAGAVSLAQSAGDGSTVRPYDPTWRDRLGSFLIGDQKPTPERRDFVSGLVGSTGLGSTGMGAVDLTPPGVVLGLQEAAQHRDPVGMALNLAAVLPIGKAVKAADAMAPEVGNAMRGIIAYHGSPHSFDKFDLSKIGTGEGAQAYGHGLYFAENEGVAKGYRDNLSTYKLIQEARDKDFHNRPLLVAQLEASNAPLDRMDQALKVLEPNSTQEMRDAWIREGQRLHDEFKSRGSMYQVRINADPAHFLDWDKPLSEQSPKVQEAFKTILANPNAPRPKANEMLAGLLDADKAWTDAAAGDKYGGWTGSRLHGRLAAEGYASPDAASSALRDQGIPGIKYLDAGSRSAGEGSRNYVVFNHDLIDILRRYAFGGSVADDAMRIASSVRPGGHDNEF